MKHTFSTDPLLIFCLLFTFFQSTSGLSKTLDGVAAIVADDPILISEVLSLQQQIVKNPSLAKIYEVSPNANKRELLEKLIESKIISVSLKELQAEVTDEDVEKQISSIANQNGITKAQLERSLKSENVNIEVYRRNIKAQLERRNVFDRVLRQSANNPSEVELRGLYDQKAGREVNLWLVDLAANASTTKKREIRAEWKDIALKVASKKMSYDEAKKQLSPYSLDWVASKSLNSVISKAIEEQSPGSVLGPLDVEGRPTLVFFEAVRRGSDEAFAKARPELEAQARAQGFESRLNQWIERRKKELQIVVNEI